VIHYGLNELSEVNGMGYCFLWRSRRPRPPATVAGFAAELKKSPEVLLEQFRAAGVEKVNADDVVTNEDKQRLLAYLQASHATQSVERKRITLVKGGATDSGSKHAKSSKPVILVPGVGRMAYEEADEKGRRLLDVYRELIEEIWEDPFRAFDQLGARWHATVRRLGQTLKELREHGVRVLEPMVAGESRAQGLARRHGAFFHALKVDGRNLP
jgi:hypothetical protein